MYTRGYINAYIDIYVHKVRVHTIYMKSSFPKRVKRQSKNLCCNTNVNFGDHIFEKSYSLICTYIYACEKLFTKIQYLNLASSLQAHFLKWRLTHFGRRALHIYICSSSTSITMRGTSEFCNVTALQLSFCLKKL